MEFANQNKFYSNWSTCKCKVFGFIFDKNIVMEASAILMQIYASQ